MKKVISFSLWGNTCHYIGGGIENADIAKNLWPDWVCRYYVSPNVPIEAVKELNKRDNVEVIMMEQDESWNGMFWRFFAATDPDVDVAIFRDSDSRLDIRDKIAVEEWLTSDKDVHIIRDNCQHGWEICGGAWGVRNGRLNYIKDDIERFDMKERMNKHGIDQIWLSLEIYPEVVHDAYVHDDWFPNQYTEEVKHPHPVPRLRGDGWWKVEFPEWHTGLQLENTNHWFRSETCKHPECCLPCPACGVYHDNYYTGQVLLLEPDHYWNKYPNLKGVLV
tara:strand:- start:3251 stop:4081 length:831 start_codon:yes stop_codon:yes gene_type:complete